MDTADWLEKKWDKDTLVQDACLRFHGWTRQDAPGGSIHRKEHCAVCQGVSYCLDFIAFDSLLPVLAAALRALKKAPCGKYPRGHSCARAAKLGVRPPRTYCDRCAAIAQADALRAAHERGEGS